MSVATVSEVPTKNPRIAALKERHSAISEKLKAAQKDLSSPDTYISQLKKQKLSIKEQLFQEEQQTA